MHGLEGVVMKNAVLVVIAVLAAAACLYFVMESSPSETQRVDGAEATTIKEERVPAGASSPFPLAEGLQRSPIAKEKADVAPTTAGTIVLRVLLEDLTEEEARMATITLSGLDERDEWPEMIHESWPSQGARSEFSLDSFFASIEQHDHLQAIALRVKVDHPHFLSARTDIALPRYEEPTLARKVYETRMHLSAPEFWPEFSLAVRDVNTREHLENIELRLSPGFGNAMWGKNGRSDLLAENLQSPIALMGGREPNQPEPTVVGLALQPSKGELPQLVELWRRFSPERGVMVSARAPGYAWSSTSIDVTKGERELLLTPAASLEVQLENVKLERYAELNTLPVLCVYLLREGGGYQYIHFEPLHEKLKDEGLQLESLVPGRYRVTVELGEGSWAEQPVLAEEIRILAEGETQNFTLNLADPPAAPERAALGGTLSIPSFGGEDEVRLQIYFQPKQSWRNPEIEFRLADLHHVGGAIPTWQFRSDDLPVGSYRLQLLPFLKVWIVELTGDGREDLDLAIPELAEFIIETVDQKTGIRVPLNQFYFRNQNPLPDQKQNDWARAETLEPGRFRIWTVPGTVRVWPRFPSGSDLEYGGSGVDFDLVPGFQTAHFELAPVYAIHFEFREDGVTLPVGDPGIYAMQNIRAVGHDGRVTGDGLQTTMRVGLSAPGTYEISFEGLNPEVYHTIAPRLVYVQGGEAVKVTVDLERK